MHWFKSQNGRYINLYLAKKAYCWADGKHFVVEFDEGYRETLEDPTDISNLVKLLTSLAKPKEIPRFE
jgi:hypothetical protein